MPQLTILPIILCGGSGTRLWPLSRIQSPKQFLRIFDNLSLLQHTIKRASSLDGVLPPLVICSAAHRFMVADHLSEINCTPSAIILEPAQRNTAPAIACALAWAQRHEPNAQLLILPSDHFIQDTQKFQRAINQALPCTPKGALATFGIRPTHPNSQYGYIEMGNPVADGALFQVKCFVEKPPIEQAAEMLGEQCWLWNSGMFSFSCSAGLQAFNAHAPAVLDAAKKALGTNESTPIIELSSTFLDAENISFDHAIMEKSSHSVVAPLDVGWADLGTWKNIWEHAAKDKTGNAAIGNVIVNHSHNNYVHGRKRTIVISGVNDLVVVDTDDALFVAHKEHAEHAKEVAQSLLQQKKPEAISHTYEQRPWGHFQSIDKGNHFKVKHISVKPGAKLSLQMHNHRAEHWVVVSGHARVTCGEKQFELKKNESSYIPVGTVHRLENIGSETLEIIEVQTGKICTESDIVRLEDDYNR